MNTSKTLLQILVEELPKRGGWNSRVKTVTQDRCRDICGYDCDSPQLHGGMWRSKSGSDLIPESKIVAHELACDWTSAIITREQYETALAASKEPMTGTGVDGWIDWAGGECPLENGTIIDAKDRYGYMYFDEVVGSTNNIDDIFWQRGVCSDPNLEIIAYRLHKPQEVTESDDEADLNECIGQTPEDLEHLTRLMVEEINYSYTDITLANAYKIASNLIDAGYRKQ